MPIALGVLFVGAAILAIGALAERTAGKTAGLGSSGSSNGSTSSGGSSSTTSSGALPAGAAGKLNAGQRTFASELAAKTGLDPTVVAGWVLSEEPASSKQAPNGANNWLNIGSTDSGFYGASNPAWSDPLSAADFTAQWLAGTVAPGFGAASSGIRAILHTAGQSISNQIAAIQHSGWASSGYPNLPSVVAQFGGSG
jgi:hypothetical protein